MALGGPHPARVIQQRSHFPPPPARRPRGAPGTTALSPPPSQLTTSATTKSAGRSARREASTAPRSPSAPSVDARLAPLLHHPGVARRLERLRDRRAHGEQPLEARRERVVAPRRGQPGKPARKTLGSARPGMEAPHLLGGEREDRRHQTHEHVENGVQHGLRGAPLRPRRPLAVEPVLAHVEVERAQVDAAEVVERVVDDVELVGRRTPCGSARPNACARCSAQRSSSRQLARRAPRRCVRIEVVRGCRAGSARCCGRAGTLRSAGRGSPPRCARRRGSPRPRPTGAGCSAPWRLITISWAAMLVARRLRHLPALAVEQ